MNAKRLENFFRCVEEHLPLHRKASKPSGAMISSERPISASLTYMPTFRQVSSCSVSPKGKWTSLHGASHVFGSVVLFTSKDGGSSLFSACSFSTTRGLAPGGAGRRKATEKDIASSCGSRQASLMGTIKLILLISLLKCFKGNRDFFMSGWGWVLPYMGYIYRYVPL